MTTLFKKPRLLDPLAGQFAVKGVILTDSQAPRKAASYTASRSQELVLHNVAEDIMAYLPVIDLARLGSANRHWHAQVRSHLLRTFQVLLQQYLPHPVAFRDVMRETGAVISGSTVLSFITRDSHWTPGDLDVYVSPGKCSEKIRGHLESIQGFRLSSLLGYNQREERDDETGTDYVNVVYKYEKLVESDDFEVVKLSVDLIESITSLSTNPITFFHSTLVMNYLTADSVVVLYPSLTFARKAVKQRVDRHCESKYKARGFRYINAPVLCGSVCLNRERTTGDRATMRVVFGNSHSSDEGTERWYLETPHQVSYGPANYCKNAACPYVSSTPS